jgi:uncharacterized protein (DUF885 family)
MKRAFKWIGIAVAVVITLFVALILHTWYFRPLTINGFYTKTFIQVTLDMPEILTQLRVLEGFGIRGHNARFADASPAGTENLAARRKVIYDTLKSYDASRFTGQDKLSYDILDYQLGVEIAGERWRYHDYPVNQLAGIQSNLPNVMTQAQQVNDATDAEHYLARLALFPKTIDQVIESLKAREDRRVIPPKFVVEKVGEQLKTFMAPGAAGNTLTVAFKEKLAKIPADKMDTATREALAKRVQDSVAANVLPAYAKLAAHLDTLRAKATENHGVWALPDGLEYYEHQIEAMTTTRVKADDLHALGLAEVARIGAQMDAILAAEKVPGETRAARLATLSKSPSQLYPATDEGRTQILKDYQAIIDEISRGLDPFFATKPKSAVVVKRVPPFTEATAPGAYYNPGPLDGSQPAAFFVNLRKPEEIARFGMRSVAYHEAIPGHHLQLSIAQELKGLPIFRTMLPFYAYSEGWALYAEQLAWEMGYQNNPLDNLGRLQLEMLRAVRLVVDTGIHAKRWSRERAIDYMVAETGMPESEVVIEVERYFVLPAQALTYKVGMIKMLALREKTKAALGSQFDLRAFHDVVLKNGAMPLTILERVVDAYIAETKR